MKNDFTYALIVTITEVAVKGLNVPEKYNPEHIRCKIAELLCTYDALPDYQVAFDSPVVYTEFPYVRMNPDITAVRAVLIAQQIKNMEGVVKVEVIRTQLEGEL